ncbi:MAG: POTRA domain-containing protein [Pararobbsia sp.]
MVGHETTIGQLIETANGITQLYQQRGYALSFAFVPRRTSPTAWSRSRSSKGSWRRYRSAATRATTKDKIRAIAAHIAADRPLRRRTFERYINVLGLLQGVKIAANVPPPTTTDGGTVLDLRSSASASTSTWGSTSTIRGVQALATALENGVLGLGEQLSVSALFPPGARPPAVLRGQFRRAGRPATA